jgi:hypothetical protein
MPKNQLSARISQIEKQLMAQYGAAISGRDLHAILGYRSGDAFRHAVHRGKLAVPTFFIDGRRGRCAATSEVARWMASLEKSLPEAPAPSGKED